MSEEIISEEPSFSRVPRPMLFQRRLTAKWIWLFAAAELALGTLFLFAMMLLPLPGMARGIVLIAVLFSVPATCALAAGYFVPGHHAQKVFAFLTVAAAVIGYGAFYERQSTTMMLGAAATIPVIIGFAAAPVLRRKVAQRNLA